MKANFPQHVLELSIEVHGTFIVIGKYERQVDLSRALRLITENNYANIKYHISTVINPKVVDFKLKRMVY